MATPQRPRKFADKLQYWQSYVSMGIFLFLVAVIIPDPIVGGGEKRRAIWTDWANFALLALSALCFVWLGGIAMLALREQHREQLRQMSNLCTHCGYPRTGLTENRCPECGIEFDDGGEKQIRTP